MSRLEAVILDVGNVLRSYDAEPIRQNISETLGISRQTFINSGINRHVFINIEYLKFDLLKYQVVV